MKIKLSSVGMITLLCGLLAMACSNYTDPISDTNGNENTGGETTYTVTFNANGGTPISPQTVASGEKLVEPAPLGTKTVETEQYDFAGWFKDPLLQNKWNFADTVTGNITLYARWILADFPANADIVTFSVDTNAKWVDAADAISKGGNNKNYIINITAPVLIAGYDATAFTFGSVTGINVSIRGKSSTDDLHLDNSGYLLKINTDQNVFLRDISLKGKTFNDKPLVQVKGVLMMKGGAKVYENTSALGGGGVCVEGIFTMKDNASVRATTASNSNGGGVFVKGGGSFTMQDNASVQGSTASNSNGGGVYVEGSGSFTMQDNASVWDNAAIKDGGGVYVANGGTFSIWNNTKVRNNRAKDKGGGVYAEGDFTMRDNTAVHDNNGGPSYSGGGVYIAGGGTFLMRESASVSNHTAGGVYIEEGTFSMLDNTSVRDNKTASSGGGVVVGANGTFTMRDNASVESNTAADNGGGVSVEEGTFTMRDNSTVRFNTSDGSGGGIWVEDGTFTMRNNASVSYNTAADNGGGIGIKDGTFSMRDSASVQSNRAENGGGIGVEGGVFTMRDSAALRFNTASVMGGGIWVDTVGKFHITNGRIASNTAPADKGSALYSDGEAEYGSFTSWNIWTKKDVILPTGKSFYEKDIRVIDGTLLDP